MEYKGIIVEYSMSSLNIYNYNYRMDDVEIIIIGSIDLFLL